MDLELDQSIDLLPEGKEQWLFHREQLAPVRFLKEQDTDTRAAHCDFDNGQALIPISGSVCNTATLLEVLVAMKNSADSRIGSSKCLIRSSLS